MSLDRLPGELLAQIARYILNEDDSNDVISLALSCRRAHACMGSIIQSRVTIRLGTSKHALLQRTLIENPHYGRKVLYLAIQGNRSLAADSWRTLLNSFPAVRSLHIIFQEPSLHAFLVAFSRGWTGRDKLQLISIQAPGFQLGPPDMMRLLSLPNLKGLLVCASNTLEYPVSSRREHRATLQHLDIARPRYVNNRHTTHSELLQILGMCSELETFACNVPVPDDCPVGSEEIHLDIPFSAFLLSLALAPFASSLLKLTIRTTGQDWSHGHSGDYLDLSGFNSLRELCVSAWCFFTTGQPSVSRFTFYNFLPTSLECLEVEFPFEIGIAGNPFGIPGQPPQSTGDNFDSPSAWLFHLAERKSSVLPRLFELTLTEDNFRLPPWTIRLDSGLYLLDSVLDKLNQAFEEVGVNLTITTRGAADSGQGTHNGHPPHPKYHHLSYRPMGSLLHSTTYPSGS